MFFNGKLYWTGTGSDPLLETDLAGNNPTEFVFFTGKRIARRDASGTIEYYFSDHLGSASVITNATGTMVEESDYYPFGGERVIANSDPNQYKFTGKERDAESGLDYFIARHYSSSLGRFLQPDEFAGGPVDAFSSNDPLPDSPLPYADITNPQSLNKYGYTYNNPLVYTDPNGHCPQCVGALLGAGAGGAVILFKTARAYVTGKGQIPTNKEIAKTLVVGAIVGAALASGVPVEPGPTSDQPQPENPEAQPNAPDQTSDQDSGAGGDSSPGAEQGKPHGNTAGNQPAELYEKYDKDGNFEKHGVSQDSGKRYSKKEVAGGEVRAVDKGTRKEMLKKERERVETNPGPKNREPWAGKRKPQ